jgi:hypothetical protein
LCVPSRPPHPARKIGSAALANYSVEEIKVAVSVYFADGEPGGRDTAMRIRELFENGIGAALAEKRRLDKEEADWRAAEEKKRAQELAAIAKAAADKAVADAAAKAAADEAARAAVPVETVERIMLDCQYSVNGCQPSEAVVRQAVVKGFWEDEIRAAFCSKV